jgi:tetratricopeptide (TPR) repeat protein
MDPGNPSRLILAGIVDAIAASADPETVTPRLMAYGRTLHYAARWKLSADAYRTVIAHAHPIEEADSVIDANMQFGYCARMLGQWDEAALAYTQAGEIAVAIGDIVKVLRARIADAKLAIDRGNLPAAEGILDETVARATEPRGVLREIRSLALHERAVVAHLRGDYERSVRFAYEALENTSSPTDRDRVLADIAVMFIDLGVLSAARDALLIVAATAQEQYLRWASTINLLDISARERCEPVFEQYRRELADASLPASLEAAYYLTVGTGYAAFGRDDAARVALSKAVELATQHKLHQVGHQAEVALQNLEKSARETARATPYEPSEHIEEIVAAIKDMREVAGLAG